MLRLLFVLALAGCHANPNPVLSCSVEGCCSYHGGVCGVQDGKIVCCDDTLSPTCVCQ